MARASQKLQPLLNQEWKSVEVGEKSVALKLEVPPPEARKDVINLGICAGPSL
jgi:hypothetical protein